MVRILAALGIGLLLASIAWPCSLCQNPVNRATLGEEFDLASFVVHGELSNPRLDPTGVGVGTTDLKIEKVLKGELGELKTLTISRYVPIPDAKKPPKYLVFLEKSRDRFDALVGVAIKSPALLEYIEGSRLHRAKGRVAALAYYGTFLSHADEQIAIDAFFEFAKSSDAEVAQAGRLLDRGQLRELIEQPKLDADRLSLFAFLLGSCGNASDADFLAELAKSLDGDRRSALDGVLAGYIQLRPKQGWARVQEICGDAKQTFVARHAAWRTMRCLQNWRPGEYRAEILRGMESLLRDGEFADFALEDLARWQWWDLTPLVAQQFDQPSHKAPIIRNSIIRYAVRCPSPEARTLLARARRIDPEYVADQEKLLAGK